MKKNSNEKAALGRLHAPKGNQPSCARCWLELPLGLRSTPPPSLSKEKEQKIYIDPFFFKEGELRPFQRVTAKHRPDPPLFQHGRRSQPIGWRVTYGGP